VWCVCVCVCGVCVCVRFGQHRLQVFDDDVWP
jgi:hypothetical protein